MRRIVTVATYFEDVLGTPIDDAQGLSKHPDFIISSECGNECAKAIAAAGALLASAEVAGVETDQIVRSVNHIVLVFIYG